MPPKKTTPPVEVQGTDAEETATATGTALIAAITERPAFIDLLVYGDKQKNLDTIAAKRAEYDKVVINGVDDKENYALVKANMEQMRDDRRAFENSAYGNFIDPLKAALKIYTADVDAVIDAFKAGEKSERDKKDFIDNEKKRIKQEAEEAKAKAALVRIETLGKLGAVLDGTTYKFAYDDSLIIDALQLKEYDEAEFNDFVAEVQTAYDAEQKRLADEKAEQERQAELVQQQAEANATQQKQLNERLVKIRIKELRLLGAELTPDGYAYDPIPDTPDAVCFTWSENFIETATDEEWEAEIERAENYEYVPVEPEPEEEQPEEENAVPSGNPVVEPEQSYVANDSPSVDVSDLFESVRSTLTFTEDFPFTDSDITPKAFMRVYPDEFAEESLKDASIINQGKFQALNWAIIKKNV